MVSPLTPGLLPSFDKESDFLSPAWRGRSADPSPGSAAFVLALGSSWSGCCAGAGAAECRWEHSPPRAAAAIYLFLLLFFFFFSDISGGGCALRKTPSSKLSSFSPGKANARLACCHGESAVSFPPFSGQDYESSVEPFLWNVICPRFHPRLFSTTPFPWRFSVCPPPFFSSHETLGSDPLAPPKSTEPGSRETHSPCPSQSGIHRCYKLARRYRFFR